MSQDISVGPLCCGLQSKWVEQSVNLKYWYCTECKNEVKSNAQVLKDLYTEDASPTSGAFIRAANESSDQQLVLTGFDAWLPSKDINDLDYLNVCINELVRRIQENIELMSVPKVFIDKNGYKNV